MLEALLLPDLQRMAGRTILPGEEMTDLQNIDAECVHCQGNVFRAWWVIDRDNPAAGASQLLVWCLKCQTLSELRDPAPETIRWDRHGTGRSEHLPDDLHPAAAPGDQAETVVLHSPSRREDGHS